MIDRGQIKMVLVRKGRGLIAAEEYARDKKASSSLRN
jgi:hypothetical protein